MEGFDCVETGAVAGYQVEGGAEEGACPSGRGGRFGGGRRLEVDPEKGEEDVLRGAVGVVILLAVPKNCVVEKRRE